MEAICPKPWENFLVEVNGDCYFCCFIIRPGGKIGNLKRKTLEEVWMSRKARRIRRTIIRGKIPYCCQICPYYGEFKHGKSIIYRAYFLLHKTWDAFLDVCQGGFTRHRIILKLKKLSTPNA
jgi:radical SAM protein with 4Fe4S-binding SPASM domain